MKNSKKTKKLIFSVALIVAMVLSACQKETDAPGMYAAGDIIITNDLSVLLTNTVTSKEGTTSDKGCPAITSAEVFPVNGCKDFTVGVGLDGWVYIETQVTVCCACAICGVHNMQKQKNETLAGYKIMTVETSSSVIFNEYEISIAPGDYEIDERGGIIDLTYKVVVNK